MFTLTATPFKRCILFLLGFVAFFVVAPVLRAQDTGDLVGEVRLSTTGGFPPQKVMVSLQIRGAPMDSVYCDNEGRFAFYNLLPNLYYVAIESDDYQPVRVSVVVNPKISRTSSVHISLMPKEKAAAEKPPDAASGSNPFAISASDSGKSFPPEVKKEYDAGVKADGRGKAEEAIRHYQKAVELAPDFYPARNNLGVHYMDKGDLKQAEEEFAQVIKVHQSDATAYFNLGNVYYLTKRYDVAASTLQDGLRRDPTSALGNFLMGAVSNRQGQYDPAEKYLRRAIELDASMSRAHLELVNLYLQQQKKKEAVDELKSFEKLFPFDPLLPQVKATLAKLESNSAN
jgi:tetratricopeptide (TPR) repeat protein